MADATGEAKEPPLRVAFDRRIKLEFHGARITSDGGLLAYRELDDVFGLTAMGASALGEGRRGRNIRHHLPGLLRQAVYGRLAGYEDVNDAERLARDPVMRAIVGREGLDRPAASTSQMGRFETEWLASEANLAALTDLSGAWIDRVHGRRPPDGIILDMDSSESPTHGQQEGSAWNGHFGCTCYHPLFVFNQLGDLERCALRPGNVHSAEGWREVLEPVIARYRERRLPLWFRGDAAFAKPELYELLEAEGIGYAIRLPANRVLQERIGHLLTRPVGRPPRTATGLLRQLQLSGTELGQAAPCRRQGRVAPGRALSARRLHRHQPEAAGRAGQQVLQWPRYRRAVDPRGKVCVALDAAVLPLLPPQRRAPPAPRPCLQPRQLPALAGPAGGGRAVVADDACARSW